MKLTPMKLTPMDEIEAAIIQLENAAFDCGEWSKDSCEEPYDVVSARTDSAREKLLGLIRRAVVV